MKKIILLLGTCVLLFQCKKEKFGPLLGLYTGNCTEHSIEFDQVTQQISFVTRHYIKSIHIDVLNETFLKYDGQVNGRMPFIKQEGDTLHYGGAPALRLQVLVV